MTRTGRPPKPVEQKRMLGNPGRRPLPELDNVIHLEPAHGIPDPPRPLGTPGRELWDRAWGAGRVWISPTTDIELVQMVCEQLDERVSLRVQVLREGRAEDRKALRDIDRQIITGLSLLGFTPTDRTRLGVAEVKAASKLEEIRARRAQAAENA